MDFKANIRKQHGFRFNDINPTGLTQIGPVWRLSFALPSSMSVVFVPISFILLQQSEQLGQARQWFLLASLAQLS